MTQAIHQSSAQLTKRFTIAEYHRLTELGFLKDSDRVELIRGELVYMAAKGTAHETFIRRLLRELPKLLEDQATLCCQSPITLPADSEPEPDFAIVENRADDYFNGHPLPAEVKLTIEIADSSLTFDQTVKLGLYAEAGIEHYWIFNLLERHLEVYQDSYQKSDGTFGYRLKQIVLPHEAIAPPILSHPRLQLSVVFPAEGDRG
jgi:Uma2 family endonuclease